MAAYQIDSDTTPGFAKEGSGHLPRVAHLEIDLAKRVMPQPAVRKKLKEIYENTLSHTQTK